MKTVTQSLKHEPERRIMLRRGKRFFWIGFGLLVSAAVWGVSSYLWLAYRFSLADQHVNTSRNDDYLANLYSDVNVAVVSSLLAIPLAAIGIPILILGRRWTRPSIGSRESQFSVRLLLVVTLYAASFCTLFRISLPFAIFVSSVLPTFAICTLFVADLWSAMTPRQSPSQSPSTRRKKSFLWKNFVLVLFTLLVTYITSIGPAVATTNHPIAQVIYMPLIATFRQLGQEQILMEYVWWWERYLYR